MSAEVPETEVPEAAVHSAQGGDTSNFQPVCTYPGLQFAYCKATEGTTFIDHTFPGNFHNAGKLVARGAYHFYHPSLSATDQARFFWAVVKAQNPVPGDFLVADIEIMVGEDGSWTTESTRMNQPEVHAAATAPVHDGVLTSGARLFLDTLAGLAGPHHPVLVYTNLSVGAQLTSCTGYDLIIAWPSRTAPVSVHPWKTWRMWQFGASGGPCGGDPDAYNGTTADLQAWQDTFQSGPPKPPDPTPPPVPSRLVSMSGDDMIYLPNGAGAVGTLLVPAAVPQADGTFAPPKVLRLATNAAASVETMQGPSAAWSDPFAIDFGRGPNPVTLDTPLPAEVKVRRVDAGTNYITADFA